ncbi:toll/interleukin-1 receptor domain-containing protein [Dongia sedimenti]|uniref:TIR domain-containing protein n=1 Tax=Dongia sedimenti TaxID=3064282 RepID=A0ABU0YVV4_9PROT|nr:TIR domain-containing protein [Rhodospirillaceae bacterium R-7]
MTDDQESREARTVTTPDEPGFLTTRVFLSYAHADKTLADAVAIALKALSAEHHADLDVVQDSETFKLGVNISDQIINTLQETDILLVFFTDSYKESLFTGMEVGIFKAFQHSDKLGRRAATSEAITVFVNQMLPLEEGVLGIKLYASVLAEARIDPKKLDPGRQFLGLFVRISDLLLQRSFTHKYGPKASWSAETNNIHSEVRNRMADKIAGSIEPKLLQDIVAALSGLIQNTSLEQKLIEIVWEGGKKTEGPAVPATTGNVMTGAETRAPLANGVIAQQGHDRVDRSGSKPVDGTTGRAIDFERVLDEATLHDQQSNAFTVLGIALNQKSKLTWGDFCAHLVAGQPVEAVFVIEAIRTAVAAALKPGPSDNEQFFRSPTDSKLYRIIVTRHYGYYDGKRVMNVYLIPMLTPWEPNEELSMLSMATRYRSLFLDRTGEVSLPAFRLIRYPSRRDVFKERVAKFVRYMRLIEHEAHSMNLDTPEAIQEFMMSGSKNTDSARASKLGRGVDDAGRMFEGFNNRKAGLIKAASAVQAALPGTKTDVSPEFKAAQRAWLRDLEDFINFVSPLNKQFGLLSARRLFESYGGKVLSPSAGAIKSRRKNSRLSASAMEATESRRGNRTG